ncbi:MAG: DUF1134 domain-containing protein [Bauldia sp.]|nr:DUF1134 domain-containing protein [Bauldia sp.]MCW5718873.1 DUF1134 domain-containing protein [Bauldia sp.]
MIRSLVKRFLAAAVVAFAVAGTAQQASAQANAQYTGDQLVAAGNSFFTQLSGNLASVIEEAISRFGLPNGYILGQTAGGAIIGGVRIGEGTLYTQNAGTRPVYWIGPSIGFDVGADASQTMMLVYNLPSVEAVYQRFFGVSGSAFVVGGVGMTVLTNSGITVVPIVSGLGARLGFNIGYLKFTPTRTVNPF